MATASTKKLAELLHLRYPSPKWISATEVKQEQDDGGARFADFAAMAMSKHNSYRLIMVETKVSRADFLAEKRVPAKAHETAKYSDQAYYCIGNPDILEFGEIPAGFGVLVPNKDNTALVLAQEASIRTDHPPPPNEFWAAFLHRAFLTSEDSPEAHRRMVEKAYETGYSKGVNQGKKYARNAPLRQSKGVDKTPLNLP